MVYPGVYRVGIYRDVHLLHTRVVYIQGYPHHATRVVYIQGGIPTMLPGWCIYRVYTSPCLPGCVTRVYTSHHASLGVLVVYIPSYASLGVLVVYIPSYASLGGYPRVYERMGITRRVLSRSSVRVEVHKNQGITHRF